MLNVAVRKKLLPVNPCWNAEFPVAVRGLFRPHYMAWSEPPQIEAAAPVYLKHVIRIVTETGLRVYGNWRRSARTWAATLRRAKVRYFRIYDLRSTYATRLSAGGVADEWVTQLLRQGDAQVFKRYSQMKLQMKRSAAETEPIRERGRSSATVRGVLRQFCDSRGPNTDRSNGGANKKRSRIGRF